MNDIKKTRRHATTYLGRRANTIVEHFDTRRDGVRRVTTTWIDDAAPENGGWPAGTTVTKVIEGDAWRGTRPFRVIEEEHEVA